jgi:hypothetical protein
MSPARNTAPQATQNHSIPRFNCQRASWVTRMRMPTPRKTQPQIMLASRACQPRRRRRPKLWNQVAAQFDSCSADDPGLRSDVWCSSCRSRRNQTVVSFIVKPSGGFESEGDSLSALDAQPSLDPVASRSGVRSISVKISSGASMPRSTWWPSDIIWPGKQRGNAEETRTQRFRSLHIPARREASLAAAPITVN